MKKIVFSVLIGMFAIFNAHASDKEQITDLINTIKNAPAGSITTNYISEDDDCVRMLINKDGKQFLYERACFSVGLRLKGFDPVKYANYRFTVYNDDGTETEIKGDYQKFKELIDIVPKPKEHDMKNEIFGEMCDGNANGFYILSENDNEITVEYYAESNESETHVFPKIFDKDGVKVYFGGDKDIFVNNKGKWKNYGHKCTEMEYQSVTQKSDSGEIRIVWYKEKRDPNILVDLAADADPWGVSDVMLVYKLKCDDGGQCKQADKTPLVFLREGQGNSFKNADMTIRYGEFDGGVKWKIDSKLCKSIPDCLKSEADFWDPIEIKYIGRYSGKIDGYTDVDVYGLAFEKEKPNPHISSTYNVRPRFWAVRGDKLVRELDFDEGVDVLNTIKNAENVTNDSKDDDDLLIDIDDELARGIINKFLKEFEMSEKEKASDTCDGSGFEILSETDKNITVKYYSGPDNKEFVFPKIFDEDGVKVYWGGDNDIFINNNGKWKNRGHRCTRMKQRTYVHEYDAEHKIKIVWYAPSETEYYNDDIILVYKQICKNGVCKNIDDTPTVFASVGDLRPTIKDVQEGKSKWIEATDDVSSESFKNEDTIISHDFWHLVNEEKWLVGPGKVWVFGDSNQKDVKNNNKNIPDAVKKAAKSLTDRGFDLVYVGRYPGEFDGYTDVDIYHVSAPAGTDTGFPILYAVRGDKIIRNISGFKSLDVLKTVLEKDSDSQISVKPKPEPAAPVSDEEVISKLVDTIKKAPAGSITATDVPVFDDCRHVKINKDGKQFLYERACFSVGLRLKGFDPVKYANYRFTVYNDDGTETEIKGDYSKFKELIDVIPEPVKKEIDTQKSEKNVNETCDTGFEIQPGFRKWMVVKYNDEPADEDHMYLRILDNKNMKVYYGGDGNTFVNKDDKWTIYGPRCKGIKQQSFIHECDAEHKIKIVWYEDPNSETHFANDFILVHRMQCDKNGICENIDDGYPIVFVFDKVGFPKSGEKVPYGTMVRAAMGDIFKHKDLVIWHGTIGADAWNIDEALCKF